jgi:hypothetical protein
VVWKKGGKGRTYVLTGSSSDAGSAVEEILLEAVARVAEFGGGTGEHAVAVVAGVGVVPLGVATHDGFTLLVARGTLSGSAFETTAAVCAVVLGFVFGTVGSVAGAFFLGIALAAGGATDRVGACELAVSAAVFVGVVADGVVLEFAGLRVAALVVAAGGIATAVALFVAFYDSVSAGLASS